MTLLQCLATALTAAAAAAGQPPAAPVWSGSAFSLYYESLIQPEDIMTVHTTATDGASSSLVRTAAAHGNDTTLTRNDLGMLYLITTRGAAATGLECYAFNTTGAPQPLPQLPRLTGMTFVGSAVINQQPVDHYQARRGSGGSLLLGAYVASAPPRHLVQITNDDNMAQTMSAWEMDITPPAGSSFDVPAACSSSPVLGRAELAAALAARGSTHGGYLFFATLESESTDPAKRTRREHGSRRPAPLYTLTSGGAGSSSSSSSTDASRARMLMRDQETAAAHHAPSLSDLTSSANVEVACTAASAADVQAACTVMLPAAQAGARFDAREQGWVAQPRDQGFCGSCWSFSTAATVETAAAKADPNANASTTPAHLAPQALLDCVPQTMPGVTPVVAAKGCFGGWHPTALAWIHVNGLPLESKYQYQAVDGYCGGAGAVEGGVFIQGMVAVPPGDTSVMAATIQKYGAVSAVIQVLEDFVLYSTGIYDNPACGETILSHAVSVIGFGATADGVEYWLVKNSFGRAWGEAGYFKMKRGVNMCGIENWAYAAVV